MRRNLFVILGLPGIRILSAALIAAALTAAALSGCDGKNANAAVPARPQAEAGAGGMASPGAAGTQGPEASVQPKAVGYRAEVVPIFEAKCNYCHHPKNAVQVDLTRPFDPKFGIVNRPNTWTRSEKKILVVPGDPEASALILKVERTDLAPKVDGDPMPWNIPRLTERELSDLRRWLAEGARKTEFYRSTIARIFGDGVSLGSRGGKCSYCHYPEADFGPDLTDPFHPERGIGLPSAYGDPRVVPGNPEASLLYIKVATLRMPEGTGKPMPLHFERLDAAERRVLRDWITRGALDD